MPILSFASSRNKVFVKSTNKARNPGRGATGNGFIVLSGICHGFTGWTAGAIDLSGWYSECTYTSVRLENLSGGGTIYRTNKGIIKWPDYFNHTENPEFELIANQQLNNNPPPSGVFVSISTIVLSDTSMIREWRTNDANNTLLFSTQFDVGGEHRDYELLFDSIDAAFPGLIAFPFGTTRVDAYQVTNSGVQFISPSGGGVAQGGLVHAALQVSNVGFSNIPSPFPFYGPMPGVIVLASKRKARYLSTTPAEDRRVKFTVTNGASSALTVTSSTSLPNGIEIAEPEGFPLGFYSELPQQPVPPASTLVLGAVRRRYIIPPNSFP